MLGISYDEASFIEHQIYNILSQNLAVLMKPPNNKNNSLIKEISK